MEVLRTNLTFKCINTYSADCYQKTITCRHCEEPIDFMYTLPYCCRACRTFITFPEHLFATINNRLQYFKEGY
jgi:hypothetical protein